MKLFYSLLLLNFLKFGYGQNYNFTKRDFDDNTYNHPEKIGEKFRQFGIDYRLEYNIDELPNTGTVAKVPWPGSFWPTMFDAINDRWNKEKPNDPSPSEKYAMAFNVDPGSLQSRISAKLGLDSPQVSKTRSCTTNAECGAGSRCGRSRSSNTGKCIPEWYGLCHAWAAASIMEPEPRCPVTVNGIKFNAADISALVTVIYDAFRPNYAFMGSRCNTPTNSVTVDSFGRPTDLKCRDINAGTFHLIITNFIGLDKKSIIIDSDSDNEVWNYPTVGYRITSKTLISNEEAGSYFNRNAYPFEPKALRLMKIKMTLMWVTESYPSAWPLVYDNKLDPYYVDSQNLEYILELDRQNNIIGGQWINESRNNHPDFIWIPISKHSDLSRNPIIFSSGSGAGDGIRYSDVSQLLKKSVEGNCDPKDENIWK